MFCKYCGTENKDDAKFCRSCGKNILKTPDTEKEFNEEIRKTVPVTPPTEDIKETYKKPEKSSAEPEIKPSKPEKKHNNKAVIIVLLVLIFFTLAAVGTFGAVKYFEFKADEQRIAEERKQKEAEEERRRELKDKEEKTASEEKERETGSTSSKTSSMSPSSEIPAETSQIASAVKEPDKEEERGPESGIHNYDIVIGKTKWTTAKKKAENAYKDGKHGEISYLVHIDSMDEFYEIINVLEDKLGKDYTSYQFFIGGRRDKDGYEYTYRYKDKYFSIPYEVEDALWASGENSKGTISEPNYEYEGKPEEYIKMSKWDQSPYNWAWFDVPNDNGGFSNTAYIIEYEE